MHGWLGTQTTIYVSSYYDVCVLILRAAWRERREGGDEWVATLHMHACMYIYTEGKREGERRAS